ncbi:Ig-like domain-containing protein [Carnobacterium gallinarum]|uniref:Ig-like domain-containing protein n=1 Tax=Carnobacterium gallinarum TaxID=2749 RepID=UPI0005518FC4|nr:Ig-like domain-containing protein [Carnobacterium gallinarum]
MIKLKLVGLGMVLCCGIALGQLNADAATLEGTVGQETTLESYLPNQSTTQKSPIKSLIKDPQGEELSRFVTIYELSGIEPSANYLNGKGYVTTETKRIQVKFPPDTGGYTFSLIGEQGDQVYATYTKDYAIFDVTSLKAYRYQIMEHMNVSAGKLLASFDVKNASNEVPVITAPDRTLEVGTPFDALEGVTAYDEVDGNLTNIQIVSNNVNTRVPGNYEVHYQVVDSDNNIGTAVAQITVVEKSELAIPVTNKVLDTDKVVTGTAEKNTTLYLKMGLDMYKETVGADGTFSLKLDTTYTGGTLIEAYVEDSEGRISKTYTGSVQQTKIEKPLLEQLTNKDKVLNGSGRANTTLVVNIGEDEYEETIHENGLFKSNLDQTYPVGTPIEAYILDPVTGQKSDSTHATVMAAEVISLNRVTSEDKKITGNTIANADIKVKVDSAIVTRSKIYRGKSDASGNFNLDFSIAYSAGSSIEVEVTNPTTGSTFKKTIQVYPKKPSIDTLTTGEKKVTGLADPFGEIVLMVNNQEYAETADAIGNYVVKLDEVLPSGAVVTVYQVVDGIKSEVAELVVQP